MSAYSGVATWSPQAKWGASLSANWPDIMLPLIQEDINYMYDAGTVPFLNAMFKPGTTQARQIVQDIRAGRYDAEINAWLRQVLVYVNAGRKCVIAPYPEMNGPWVNYGPDTNNLDTKAVIDIYQSFVTKGRELGLTPDKVLWCWAPNDVGWGPLKNYWPGDEYVDIVGGSAYNWGRLGKGEPWETPEQVINPFVRDIRRLTSKPIIITQTGSGEGDSQTQEWLDQLVKYTNSDKIDGFIWFSISEFTYQPGADDFKQRISTLNNPRPDKWFEPVPVLIPMPQPVTPAPKPRSIDFDFDQADWGAKKIFADNALHGSWEPTQWVIHYGGNAVTRGFSGVQREKQVLRIYERSHLSRGWQAIAYNYAVGNSGKAYRLRGENRPGATKYANKFTRAILWIGGKGQEPSSAARETIARIVSSNSDPVYPHSYYRPTNCPGDYWREWIKNFSRKEATMPKEQWERMIDSLFAGRPDEFAGNASYWKELPVSSPGWDNFWAAFVRVIS